MGIALPGGTPATPAFDASIGHHLHGGVPSGKPATRVDRSGEFELFSLVPLQP